MNLNFPLVTLNFLGFILSSRSPLIASEQPFIYSFSLQDHQSGSPRISTVKGRLDRYLRNYKGKLSYIGGKEVVSVEMSTIKSIRELEWVQIREEELMSISPLCVYLLCLCGVYVFVYPDIICSFIEIGFTYMVADQLLVYL